MKIQYFNPRDEQKENLDNAQAAFIIRGQRVLDDCIEHFTFREPAPAIGNDRILLEKGGRTMYWIEPTQDQEAQDQD